MLITEFFTRDRRKTSFPAISIVLLVALVVIRAEAQDELPSPSFSHASGFYDNPFNLVLSTGVTGASIYFTTDGSEPDTSNLEGSTYQYKNAWPRKPGDPYGPFLTGAFFTHLYTHPIKIDNRSSEPDSLTNKSSSYDTPPWYFPQTPVFKGKVIRAIAVKEGYNPSPVRTQTYFVHPAARERYSLPVITIATSEDNLFDYYKGVYTPGAVFDEWRKNNPTQEADGGKPANYHQRGVEWEYPAHFAFWDSHSVYPDLSQDIGFRIHGGWSRAFPMKSLRIYARSMYGESRLAYSFFGAGRDEEYKRLILRNSGNDYHYTLFRDALIQHVFCNLNFEIQAYRPALVFINGEYWGIHNIRERYDKHYFLRVAGIDHDSLDYLTHHHTVKEGDNTHYLETLSYIRDNGLAGEEHYEYVRTRIDTENFIDYQIANIFSDNTDWPANNIDFWRKRTASFKPDAPYGHDGRWRWAAFDMDFGFGLYWKPASHNTLEFATRDDGPGWPNPPWSTFLLRSFLENNTFREQFIIRFADLLNTSLLTERIEELTGEFTAALEPEIAGHISRWRTPESVHAWRTHINVMLDFIRKRNSYQWRHLMEYFGLPDTLTVRVNTPDTDKGYVRINSIDLLPGTPGTGDPVYPWKGTYFGEIPVILEAVAFDGYKFSHWEGGPEGEATNPLLRSLPSELQNVTAHFVRAGPPPGYTWFYSKPEGEPAELSTWGDRRDGSGNMPVSFSADSSVFHITNRSTAKLSVPWQVSGNGSKVVIGNGTDPVAFIIPPEAEFSGCLDVRDGATLILRNIALPGLKKLAPGSAVYFEQEETTDIPRAAYGTLHLKNGVKRFSGNYAVAGNFAASNTRIYFEENSLLTMAGDLSYSGTVTTQNPENVNMHVRSAKNQAFSAKNGNLIEAYNFYIEKDEGHFELEGDIYARNNLRLQFGGTASFSDGGHTLQLDDDLRITGGDSRFELSGTVLLTAQRGTNDLEVANVALNDLVIDVTGDARPDFRFAASPLRLNNLTIRSRSERPVRFGDANLHVRGDMILDFTGHEQTEQGQSFMVMNGKTPQSIINNGYDGSGLLANLVAGNETGITIKTGNITFDGLLQLGKGNIITGGNRLLKLGPRSSHGELSHAGYVDGPLGIYMDNSSEPELRFPLGKSNRSRPLHLETSPPNSQTVLLIAEYYDIAPPDMPSAGELFRIIPEAGYYTIETSPDISLSETFATLPCPEMGYPLKNLRVAAAIDNMWTNIGASIPVEHEGMLRSTIPATVPGIFALGLLESHPALANPLIIYVYPNPVRTNGKLYLPETMNINMYDSKGSRVLNQENTNHLNMMGIPQGIYILKDDEGRYARLVVL